MQYNNCNQCFQIIICGLAHLIEYNDDDGRRCAHKHFTQQMAAKYKQVLVDYTPKEHLTFVIAYVFISVLYYVSYIYRE